MEKNIRLELVKAFIAVGTPVAEIPSKVRALEVFCEEFSAFATSEEEAATETALRREAESRWGIPPSEGDRPQ